MGSMQSSETHSTLLDERREMFEAALEKHVADAEAGPSGAVMELAKHVLLAGGKRWRPVLVLLAYELAGGENDEDIMPLALAFELIHTATLVHDDINDNAKLRRGVVTLHERFGSVRAVVVGDYLFVEGFALGGMYSQRIVGLIADCCARIAAAELKQLDHVGDLGTTPEDYYAIIEGKNRRLAVETELAQAAEEDGEVPVESADVPVIVTATAEAEAPTAEAEEPAPATEKTEPEA